MKCDSITLTITLPLATMTALWRDDWDGRSDRGPIDLVARHATTAALNYQAQFLRGAEPDHVTQVRFCAWLRDWETANAHLGQPKAVVRIYLPEKKG